MPRLAAVEIGGTHAFAALGDGTDIAERVALQVTDPEATLGAIADHLERWNAQHPIDALGIATFGPVRVDPAAMDHGRILATPKPGWSGADVLGRLGRSVRAPASLHTDVVAAALAEGRWGAARGCSDHVYVTVGTGVGFGIIAGSQPVTGILHPEGGHLRVRRLPEDSFGGQCPFHSDCLEGLVSGPALAARTGCDPAALSADEPVWHFVADGLAEACASLFLLLATERIVIGGGVLRNRPALLRAVRERCAAKLNNYLQFPSEGPPIVAAQLDSSGLLGAMLLAEQKLSDRS